MHTPTTLIALAAVAATAAAAPVPVKHDFNLMLRYENGSGVMTDFSVSFSSVIDVEFIEVDIEGTEALATNPLYQEGGLQGENPLFDESAGIAIPPSINGLEVTAPSVLASLSGGGIIHRDIAARNVLITTSFGTFGLEDTTEARVLFGSDAGFDISSSDAGPVRWLAPESIRTREYTTGRGSTQFLTILAGSSITTTVVPSPNTLPILGLGVLAATRRRR